MNTFFSFLLITFPVCAIAAMQPDTTRPQGAFAIKEIVDGDTIYHMALRQVRITAPRNFQTPEERRQYNAYVRAAKIVEPYALQAVELYHDIQEETQGMSKRKRRKHIKREHKDLKEEMQDKLKELSRLQGKVLIKMIERQLNKPFYDIIVETRGGITAVYWQNMGRLWGYNLKEGYREGNDPLLDAALMDYDPWDKIFEGWRGN